MATLKEKEQEKIQYGLLLLKTQDRLSTKFIKLIKDGLYELRTEYGGNIFKVFFIFDEGKIVVLFNGFQKKSQKTPPKINRTSVGAYRIRPDVSENETNTQTNISQKSIEQV